jgi:hypothetical protein
MWTRLASGLVALLAASGVVAAVGCSIADSEADSTDNAVTNVAFNKNHLLDDAVLLDDQALTEPQIQSFLEKTPFGTQSPLAEYHDPSGRAASKILHDAATAAGVNAIELLVRLQMEYALVGGQGTNVPTDVLLTDDPDAATADPDAAPASEDTDAAPPPQPAGSEAKADPMVKEKIAQAFNCGQSAGFEPQASCAAKAIARAMANLAAGHEASGGWKIGGKTTTVDKVAVTPDNAATAALYSYTPYIGEKGGGAKGTAGVAGHGILWQSFAKALKYKAPSCAAAPADAEAGTSGGGCGECSPGRTQACTPQGKGSACLPSHTCGCSKDSDCGGVSSGRVCNRQTNACEAGCRGSGNGCPFGQTCSSIDDTSGACTGTIIDAGADDDSGTTGKPDSGSSSSSKDDNGDGAGHQTPSSNSGNGSSHGSGGSSSGSSSSASSDDEDDAGTDGGKSGGSSKKGCSASGGGGGPNDLSLALALGLIACARARRRART